MPDRFYYKLLNKSGSFYFRKDASGKSYTIVPVPYDNIKITCHNNGTSFTIIDTDGTKYNFGEDSNSCGYSGKREGMGGGYRSTWKCTSINNMSRNESISFHYKVRPTEITRAAEDNIEYWDTEYDRPSTNYNEFIEYDDSSLNGVTTFNNLTQLIPFAKLASPKYKVHIGAGKSEFHMCKVQNNGSLSEKVFSIGSGNYTNMFLDKVELDYIRCAGVFIYFEGIDRLLSMRITDDNNKEIRKIKFFQSYTNSNNPKLEKWYNGLDFKGTNYLDSLHITSNSATYQKYGFIYQEKYCFGGHLKGHDAWGFVNTATSTADYYSEKTAIPRTKISF